MRAIWTGIGAMAAVAVAAAGLIPALAAEQAPTEVQAAAANDDPAFVQVVDNNLENLPTVDLQCP
ncbi:MAG TPA: hypothetical protein VH969_15180, partial [Actinophytocola sp.]|uniref:hypothetical protein n=1 Tax=Actinophytocola sp. TaxID=1872138 RepID=UPI002F92C477